MPLLLLIGMGVAVSFLGSFFSYGYLQAAATQTSQATIENFQYNPHWNHIRFNAKLLRLWIGDQTGGHSDAIEPWPPAQIRWYPVGDQGGFVETKQVNLRAYASPQPLVLREWPVANSLLIKLFRTSFFVSFLLGFAILVWAGRGALREDKFISTSHPSP